MIQRYRQRIFILFIATVFYLKQSNCLHLSTAEDAQLKNLISLQKQYTTQISSLTDEASNVLQKINTMSSQDEKVKILQEAITKQRDSISKLQYDIIPSSLDPFIRCQTISDSQKEILLNKVTNIAGTVKNLEAITRKLTQQNQIKIMKNDLSQTKDYAERIEQIILNNCTQMLEKGEKVYQTNLLSQNWVLGGQMTMDKLTDQYYKRVQQNNNISNCDIKTPYYNGRQCINCTEQDPLFDISRKICMRCPVQQFLNQTIRKCVPIPKNSNYTLGKNYVLKPLELMPLADKNLTSCGGFKPFFDKQLCVSCPMPYNYWNISESKCKQCPDGKVFNLNNRKCVQKVYNKLTVLEGTKWITNDGNITRVLEDRLQVLNRNKTTGEYSLCPKLQPYYDETSCVFCKDEFNLDTLQCSSAPDGKQFDKNMRSYLNPQSVAKQMDPKSPNYITERQEIVDNADIANCNETHPYFDQISCIYCQNPFPIFNYDDNKCVACDAIDFYNNTSHKCQQRDYIYVKGNQTNLLATENVSITDYKQNLYDSIEKNDQKIPLKCQDMTQYAAIDRCVSCNTAAGEYFNVQSFSCSLCDGTVDPETHLCHQRTYYLTNLDASNIIFQNQTKAKQDQVQQLKNNRQLGVCPLDSPFEANNRTQCGNCPDARPLFNYTAKKCVQCPVTFRYDQNIKKCRQIAYLNDLNGSIIIQPPQTIQKQIEKQQKLKSENITESCPSNAPYTTDHRICLQCFDPYPLFNISSGLCTSCPSPMKYFKDIHNCRKVYYLTDLDSQNLLESRNYTVNNTKILQDTIKNSDKKYVQCEADKPYGGELQCFNCIKQNSYFNLETKTCQQCPAETQYWPASRKCQPVTYVTNIEKGQSRMIQEQNYTISGLRQYSQKLAKKGPVKICPQEKPFKQPRGCTECPSNASYFYLRTLSCADCNNFKPQNNTCPPKPPKFPNLTNYKWVSYQMTPDETISEGLKLKQIPTATQCKAFYNIKTKDCVQCADNELFNVDTFSCETCQTGKVFDINIHQCVEKQTSEQHYTNLYGSQKDYLIYGGLTLGQLQANIEQVKQKNPESTYCDDETPYFDKMNCIKCPNYKKYFNLRYSLCQTCLFDETFNPATHNCQDAQGAAVWRKPSGQLVYPYLFG